MNRKQLIFLEAILAMSLLSALLGCKAAPLKGPDFGLTTSKILHIKPYATVEYEMPGNMSNLMGFAEKYSKNSPVTKSINTDENLEFLIESWRESLKLDGAMWDYNIKHEATLNLTIEIVKKSDSNPQVDFIKDSYEEYYNGKNGLNKEIRAEYPEHTDEELGNYIRVVPSHYESKKFNNKDFLSWVEIDGGYKHIQYAYELSKRHLLLFDFRYSIYIKKESDIPLLKEKIKEDTETFMNAVQIN